MANFLVLGLGSFGATAAIELERLGHTVTAADIQERRVEAVADQVTTAVIADVTDEHALQDINAQQNDAALIAIGKNLEASVLAVLQLKHLDVKHIWVKASSRPHHTILHKLGVTRIIHPEEEMGIKVAQSLHYPMVNQYMFVGNNVYIVEIEINAERAGDQVADIIGKHGDLLTPLMVRQGHRIETQALLERQLDAGDALILAGPLAVLKSIVPRLEGDS